MANLLENQANWADNDGETPPPSSWNGTLYAFATGEEVAGLILLYLDATPETGDLIAGTIAFENVDGFPAFLNLVKDSVVLDSVPVSSGGSAEFSFDAVAGAFLLVAGSAESTDASYYYGIAATITPGVVPAVSPVVNCDCDDTTSNRTLLSLRQELMRRLGWGAQVASPPPGVADMLNSFLIEAQELLYRRYEVLRTERFFSWPLTVNVRLYDLPDNAEECTKKLDPRKVTWAGAVRDGIWYPLICGIPPELYTHNITGRPERYEIRQCIEIWPAPEVTEGSLVIKGHFGLEAFTADSDKVTIDDRAVFLLALANAKAHYRQPDAQNYVAQLEVYIDNMVAGSHHTRRYVPGRGDRFDYIYAEPKPSVPFS